jgi:hypothetical protein
VAFGIAFKAVLTDNGTAYRFRAFAAAGRQLGLIPLIPHTLGPSFPRSLLFQFCGLKAFPREW